MEESYSVMIAEDELLVRTGIGASYSWSENSLYIVADVADGSSAWSSYQEYKPDIVVTDLCMPGISGLELIRKIRATGNRCAVIVITCLNDENTLEEARKLDVCACLIKATMRQRDIRQALNSAVNQLRQAPETVNRSSGGRRARARERLYAEYLLLNGDFDALAREMLRIGFPLLKPKTVALMLADIDCYNQSMLCKMLCGMAAEVFRKSQCDAVFGDERTQVLLASTLNEREKQLLTEQLESLSAYVHDTFDCRIRFAMTNAAPPLNRLPTWVARVLSQKSAICAAASAVVFVDDMGEAENLDLRHAFDGMYLSVWSFLPSGHENECLRRLARAEVAGKRALPLFIDALKHLAALLFYYADATVASERVAALNSELECARHITDAMRVFENEWAGISGARSGRDKKEVVLDTAECILRHPDDRCTLKSVAERVNFSPVYFSALFKQTMGIGFSEFLINARMRAACVRLAISALPVNEIADACGFSDHAYFSRRFKQQLGISPSDWRSSYGMYA